MLENCVKIKLLSTHFVQTITGNFAHMFRMKHNTQVKCVFFQQFLLGQRQTSKIKSFPLLTLCQGNLHHWPMYSIHNLKGWYEAVKLPRIFPRASLKFNGAPGNIQGSVDKYANNAEIASVFYSSCATTSWSTPSILTSCNPTSPTGTVRWLKSGWNSTRRRALPVVPLPSTRGPP